MMVGWFCSSSVAMFFLFIFICILKYKIYIMSQVKVRFIISGGGSKGAVFLGFLDRLLSIKNIKVDH